jgi:hypothetical protein
MDSEYENVLIISFWRTPWRTAEDDRTAEAVDRTAEEDRTWLTLWGEPEGLKRRRTTTLAE